MAKKETTDFCVLRAAAETTPPALSASLQNACGRRMVLEPSTARGEVVDSVRGNSTTSSMIDRPMFEDWRSEISSSKQRLERAGLDPPTSCHRMYVSCDRAVVPPLGSKRYCARYANSAPHIFARVLRKKGPPMPAYTVQLKIFGKMRNLLASQQMCTRLGINAETVCCRTGKLWPVRKTNVTRTGPHYVDPVAAPQQPTWA